MRVFHLLNREHALLAIERSRLKVAHIAELNDPFELLSPDLRDPIARKAFRAFRDQVGERHGLLCFSRHWRNTLLWSHYGDRHHGVAIEVEIDDGDAMPVRYRKTRLAWDCRAIVEGGGFTEAHVDELVRTKSHHWAYEEEVRVAISLTGSIPERGLHFSPVKITGIVLGALSELSVAEIRTVLPPGARVSVTKARLAFRSFDVVRNKGEPITVLERPDTK